MTEAEIIDRIFDSWHAGQNVLLYGPPATGKTRIMSQLYQMLEAPGTDIDKIALDPFKAPAKALHRPIREIDIPLPAKTVFTTFHQSYTYEDFVIGLRPDPTENGIDLRPSAGLFLDAALELSDPSSEYKSVVVFIDEINRGNAARIFGEFMTFLDFDYREGGTFPLPLPLRQLRYANGRSELVERIGSKEVQIPEDFRFPKDVYIVATMNSVDRAAVPIDSALARRFNRIALSPDASTLAEYWNLDQNELPGEDQWETMTPFMCAFRLFERLNKVIASDLGPEFELGHGLYMSMGPTDENEAKREDALWLKFAQIWDEILFPQLEDRFSGREDLLMEVLKVDNPPQSGSYAWRKRDNGGLSVLSGSLLPVQLAQVSVEEISRSLRWLSI